jgi:hypothetical protein
MKQELTIKILQLITIFNANKLGYNVTRVGKNKLILTKRLEDMTNLDRNTRKLMDHVLFF